MNAKVEVIGEKLIALLSEKKIIARYELLHRVYQYVREANLNESESAELRKLLENDDIAVGIFFNILSGNPIFVNLPQLDSAMQVNNVMFHFVHTGNYGDPELAKAFKQYQDAEDEINELASINLKYLLTNFMTNAGYVLVDDAFGKLTFNGPKDNKLEFRIFTSIEDVEIVDGMEGSVILVPHAESPGPFLSFYHQKGVEVEMTETKVWVANMEKATIDPFIGYPKDLAIYKQFNDPQLAMKVKTTWCRKEGT